MAAQKVSSSADEAARGAGPNAVDGAGGRLTGRQYFLKNSNMEDPEVRPGGG